MAQASGKYGGGLGANAGRVLKWLHTDMSGQIRYDAWRVELQIHSLCCVVSH
jgi:hypothetical protein